MYICTYVRIVKGHYTDKEVCVIGTLSTDVFFKPLLDFTLNVFKEICKKDKGNTLMAVASLSQELSILYEAASTMLETGDVPSSPVPRNQQRDLQECLREHEAMNGCETFQSQFMSSKLRSGVRLFVDRKVHLENNFNETMVNYFNAKVELLNFKYPEAVATRVNSWVDQLTHRIIHTIVDK
ncbi:unnamed protein product, partial [Timema podura]|nr:unnamed protein product [Timema podura]